MDLSELQEAETALGILTDPASLEAFRYLAAPPISGDDLTVKVLADTESLSPPTLRADRELVIRVIKTVRAYLDRRRFTWVTEDREPTEAERQAAILASAALMGGQRLETKRRTEEKTEQEQQVKAALRRSGFREVPVRRIRTLADGPTDRRILWRELIWHAQGRYRSGPVGYARDADRMQSLELGAEFDQTAKQRCCNQS